MIPIANNIIVRVDLDQKGIIEIAGKQFLKVPKFTTNYREKSPVVGVVDVGNEDLPTGTVIIAHHNYFSEDSQYRIADDLFSIPFTENIFATIDENGDAHPIGGNIICERIEKSIIGFSLPPSNHKNYNDRVIIAQDGNGFKKGQQVFTKPLSDYEIVYHWGNIEKRIIKVKKGDIAAILEKTVI